MQFTFAQVFGMFAAYYFFNAVAASLPQPKPEQVIYGTVFRIIQRLCANADRLAETQFAKLGLPAPVTGTDTLVARHTETDIVAATSSAAAK